MATCMATTNEQSSAAGNSDMDTQDMETEASDQVPPFASAMCSSSSRTLPQLPNGNDVSPHDVPRNLPQAANGNEALVHDAPRAMQQMARGISISSNSVLRRYPIIWQGNLILKNTSTAVQLHFVSGNPNIATASLPPLINGETAPVRISQRMRLDTWQLESVTKKMQLRDEHCILLALPCGRDYYDLNIQTNNLKDELITYLNEKMAAGIVNAPAPNTDQTAFVIHIFPACEFTEQSLNQVAPQLQRIVNGISHLVIVISTAATITAAVPEHQNALAREILANAAREQAIAAQEQPSASLEQSSVSLEQPSASREQPNTSQEQPNASQEHSNASSQHVNGSGEQTNAARE